MFVNISTGTLFTTSVVQKCHPTGISKIKIHSRMNELTEQVFYLYDMSKKLQTHCNFKLIKRYLAYLSIRVICINFELLCIPRTQT